jgi:hypothetical protein
MNSLEQRLKRRAAARWLWQPTAEGLALVGHTWRFRPDIPCGMVTSTGKRCTRGWMHRLGHRAAPGEAGPA